MQKELYRVLALEVWRFGGFKELNSLCCFGFEVWGLIVLTGLQGLRSQLDSSRVFQEVLRLFQGL